MKASGMLSLSETGEDSSEQCTLSNDFPQESIWKQSAHLEAGLPCQT
jgi:uncharacterized protein YbdZ (MbtH family)